MKDYIVDGIGPAMILAMAVIFTPDSAAPADTKQGWGGTRGRIP
ncbi:hypothetical protein Q668_02530 [Alcanivorax sp. PN-3]|nr:hypothetical protein Q668_02530 [Alcanivorax sp. PN-3]